MKLREKARKRLQRTMIVSLCVLSFSAALAQAAKPATAPLKIQTTSLPKSYLEKPYHYQLGAEGGIKPQRWRLERGNLPKGIRLDEFGLLSGVPQTTGNFHFTVVVTDSAHPAHESRQDLELVVVAPLLAVWDEYPKVSGPQITGSVLVSNTSEHDFDLTFIAVAVNSIGRATALGYQHFVLKKGTVDKKLPFSGTPSRGSYQVDVDVVAEAATTGVIYRAHLATGSNLEIAEEP